MAALVPLGTNQAAEPGAEEQLVPVGEAAANPKAKAKGRPKTNPKGRIDIDERIDAARATVRAAAKAMGAARALFRGWKKRKNRLTRKASQLSSEDLERIAVLKRTGLWAPELTEPVIERLPNNPAAAVIAAASTATVSAPSTPNTSTPSSASNAATPAIAAEIEADDGDASAEEGRAGETLTFE
jgi:hypothetical protein